MKKVNLAVEKLLRSYDLWQGYKQYSLLEDWDAIVGPAIGEVSRADSITNGILNVLVKDSVWSYHLSILKPQLIDKINKHAGSRMVKNIHFKIDYHGKKKL